MMTETDTNRWEKFDHLNQTLRETLIEVIPQVSPEIQLEISCFSEQIHQINQLILRSKEIPPKKNFRSRQDPHKFYLLLEEIQAILILAKSKSVTPEVLQNFRLKLEKQINYYRYPYFAYGLNAITYLSRIKSTPFKIFLGLLITSFTSIAIIVLIVADQDINNSDFVSANPSNQIYITSSKTKMMTTTTTSLSCNQCLIMRVLGYAATAGTLGSIASILLRIIDFHDQKYADPLVPFFVGLFKPLIGLILGLFIASLIASDTIFKIDALVTADQNSPGGLTNEARHNLFIFSCAFLIGFSERFASDFLKKAESSLNEIK
ncbi:MAG: hypothetical protein VKK07_02800 [Merismopediaceae bacterium]|nr:hypothetical protein [Merismopediaceae bacterium]